MSYVDKFFVILCAFKIRMNTWATQLCNSVVSLSDKRVKTDRGKQE